MNEQVTVRDFLATVWESQGKQEEGSTEKVDQAAELGHKLWGEELPEGFLTDEWRVAYILRKMEGPVLDMVLTFERRAFGLAVTLCSEGGVELVLWVGLDGHPEWTALALPTRRAIAQGKRDVRKALFGWPHIPTLADDFDNPE